jgi:two-component system response regulator AtoC
MNILLADDEPDVRKSLSNFLSKLGHDVVCAENGIEGLKEFHSRNFDLIITDIRMPSMDGLELMRRIKDIERSSIDVIVITGHGDMDNAVKALKYGAFDYLQKPVNVRELAIAIDRSAEYRTLRNNYLRLKEEFNERVAFETREFRGKTQRLREAYLKEIGFDDLCVCSEAMCEVIDLAEKYSMDRSIPILIQGETGTGKEVVARFIHCYSHGSAAAPFAAINCGAMPPELFESELFGHNRGAYTGAITDQMGKMEVACGGTIFLDEIGELPYNLQVKFLRVLEEGKLYRLGGVKEIPLDVRFISATNKDLVEEIEAKRFRSDLYFRINIGSIQIPPLRERKEDILPLAYRFARKSAGRTGKIFERFTHSAEEFLVSFPWPGNVRQLKNAMERLGLLGPWHEVCAQDLSFIKDSNFAGLSNTEIKNILGRGDFELPPDRLDLENLTDQIIRQALQRHGGNQTRTAQYLGISRRVLQGRLKRFGILNNG